MNFLKIIFFVTTLIVSSFSSAYFAYQKINLPKGISLDIPKSFQFLSENKKIDLTAYANSIFDDGINLNVLSFAANHYDSNGKTDALVNLRFYPDNEFSQSLPRMLEDSPNDLKLIEKTMKDELHSSPVKIIQWNGVYIRNIAGLKAVVTDYRRLSHNGESGRVRLMMFHNSKDSFHMTASYDDKKNDSFMLESIIEKIIKSLRVN